MVLSENVSDWYCLSREQLVVAIRERRNAIREHRNAVGQFRCWVDDYTLWGFIEGSPPFPEFDLKEFMHRCENFFEHRQAGKKDINPGTVIGRKSRWDDDLHDCRAKSTLRGKLWALQCAIYEHREIPLRESRERTADDDRRLYRVLPEKLVADFRLPTRAAFLGKELYPNGGCPAYWDSHLHCQGPHDFTKPGPCKLVTISSVP